MDRKRPYWDRMEGTQLPDLIGLAYKIKDTLRNDESIATFRPGQSMIGHVETFLIAEWLNENEASLRDLFSQILLG